MQIIQPDQQTTDQFNLADKGCKSKREKKFLCNVDGCGKGHTNSWLLKQHHYVHMVSLEINNLYLERETIQM